MIAIGPKSKVAFRGDRMTPVAKGFGKANKAPLFLFMLFPVVLSAQTPTGAVHGQILDPSGAAVPSAKVAAINSGQKVKPGVVHADGTYDVTGLVPGSYSVVAKAKGFEDFIQSN